MLSSAMFYYFAIYLACYKCNRPSPELGVTALFASGIVLSKSCFVALHIF